MQVSCSHDWLSVRLAQDLKNAAEVAGAGLAGLEAEWSTPGIAGFMYCSAMQRDHWPKWSFRHSTSEGGLSGLQASPELASMTSQTPSCTDMRPAWAAAATMPASCSCMSSLRTQQLHWGGQASPEAPCLCGACMCNDCHQYEFCICKHACESTLCYTGHKLSPELLQGWSGCDMHGIFCINLHEFITPESMHTYAKLAALCFRGSYLLHWHTTQQAVKESEPRAHLRTAVHGHERLSQSVLYGLGHHSLRHTRVVDLPVYAVSFSSVCNVAAARLVAAY